MVLLKEEDIKFMESLKEEAVFLFEHITHNGVNIEDAVEMVKVIVRDNDIYLNKAASISVPIRFKLSWLDENANWSNLSYREKDKVLWSIGMDTRQFKYEVGKLFSGENTEEGFKYKLTEFVYGQERLDKKWLTLCKPINGGTTLVYYSSEEARNYEWFRKHVWRK